MPLNIDYRPQNFDEFIGNESTVQKLRSVILRKDVPHVFLFHGPSGTGKTTLARIVAKKLGCLDMDIQEMNIADIGGIDTARDIRSKMRLKPISGGKIKVYILDEIQRSSQAFMQSLLKPLEDAPSHCFFILCTTDPQKLNKALRNRCSPFQTSLLNQNELLILLDWVLKQEDVELSKELLYQIAQTSKGSPRQALIILDQIIDLKPEERERCIQDYEKKENQAIDLCRELFKERSSWRKINELLENIEDDPETVRRIVLGYFRVILKKGKNPKARLIMDYFLDPFYENGKERLFLACYDLI